MEHVNGGIRLFLIRRAATSTEQTMWEAVPSGDLSASAAAGES
jgi:hypothetical protein